MFVLVSGKARSGKDYLANLMTHFSFNQISFASHLKDLASTRYQIDRELFDTQEGKASFVDGRLARDYLIELAAEYRKFDNDYFVRTAFSSLPPGDIVVSDFRYPSEYDFIRKWFPDEDVRTIRVSRKTELNLDTPSEKALDLFHFDYYLDDATTSELASFIVDSLKE